MKRKKGLFDDGDTMVRNTSGDYIFDLVAKPRRQSDDWYENDNGKQKYKNLSRKSLDEVMNEKYR